MEIRPTTIVKLFSGVPLNNTYTDTLYFSSLTAQSSYFAGLTPVKTFTSQMYQRVNKGQFEANCKADDIYNCNYMAFQNSGFGNKWFYAFINSIEYINNNNSLVSFEIDVMQTWMFDYDLKRCFIERQHSVGDAIGGNILPEPVELGEYVFDVSNGNYNTSLPYDKLFPQMDQNAILIMCSEPYFDDWQWGNVYDNVYSGCYLYAVDATSNYAEIDIRTMIYYFTQKPECILNMYMCPKFLLPAKENNYARLTDVPDDTMSSALTGMYEAPSNDDSFGGYVPKNKKLYTYPYNFFHIDDGNGNSLKLRYEFFSNNRPQVKVEGCITTPIQVRLTPYNYKGTVETPIQDPTDPSFHRVECRSEFLTIANYPLCSWNYDTYRAWVAQNSVPMLLNSNAQDFGNLLTGNFSGILKNATQNISNWYRASIMGDTCKGNYNSGNVNFSTTRNNFFGGRCHITMDYAIMIDNFFSMYGYAYNKLGIPNTHSRPHWNYVKTVGAKIIGECPADDIKKICDIYDNGITFWKNASEVGNYNLDNSPT